jgi:hypothetical protein
VVREDGRARVRRREHGGREAERPALPRACATGSPSRYPRGSKAARGGGAQSVVARQGYPSRHLPLRTVSHWRLFHSNLQLKRTLGRV